jgi:hypothetical protein
MNFGFPILERKPGDQTDERISFDVSFRQSQIGDPNRKWLVDFPNVLARADRLIR